VALYAFALAASSFFVAWAGDRDEKIAIALYGVASIVSAWVVTPLTVRFHSVEGSVMTVDVALLVPFLLIVVQSTRNWPLWCTAFQVVTVVANSVVLSPASRHAYAATLYLLSYGVLAAIVAGAINSRRRRLQGRFLFLRRQRAEDPQDGAAGSKG